MLSQLMFLLCGLASAGAGRLTVQGNTFQFDNQQVFLSGANLAHGGYNLGRDSWGNSTKDRVVTDLQTLSSYGANSIRVWMHNQGETNPIFDDNGYVTGLDDGSGMFLTHLNELLDTAQQNNILVFVLLWNPSQGQLGNLSQLILEDDKLQSYIDNALTPMVNAVKDHPAFGGWDVINQPESVLIPNQANTEPCFDTTGLAGTGIGYSDEMFTYERLLRFINLQTAAIKAADPTALVTVGAWDAKSNTDTHGYFNHYKDECLTKAGGNAQGTLDFWAFHSYAWQGSFDVTAPFSNKATDYNSDRPIVVGEFWHQGGAGMNDSTMIQYIYNNDYQGAWILVYNDDANADSAIKSISQLTSNGVIPITI